MLSTNQQALSEENKKVTFTLGGKEYTFYAISEKQKAENERRAKEEKEKARLKRIENLKINSLMDRKFKNSTFENFTITPENKKYFEMGKRYVENFDAIKKENHGLLIHGKPGTCKSYLSFAIANELINKRIPVVAVSAGSLINKMKELAGFGSLEEIFFYNRLASVDLLIIDDLGSEYKNPWSASKLYEVIDARYRSELPIIITTNLDIPGLINHLTYDGITRTYDRINEMTVNIEMTGEQQRIRKADEKEKAFKQIFRSEK